MILQFQNKRVNITIPKTVRRLKKEFWPLVYDDEGPQKQDKVFRKLSVFEKKEDQEKFFFDQEVKTVGIWMSGGADSSLLAWLLAKEIIDEKLDVRIQPMSVRRGRGWNPLYAGEVVDFIIKDLNFKNMNEHLIYYPDINDEHQREFQEFWDRNDENFIKDVFQILYAGITSNPPKNSGLPQSKERSRDEDVEKELVVQNNLRTYMTPLFDVNKSVLADIYANYNLTDTLFPITRSCEGSIDETGNYTFHCGNCWWCQERFWAFGRLV